MRGKGLKPMQKKIWIVTSLALLAVCGVVSAARAGSGRATGPTGTSPAPPPPQEQKPADPPKSQRPSAGPDDANKEADAEKRKRMFQEYRAGHHDKSH